MIKSITSASNITPLRITPPDDATVWDVLRRAQQTGAHLVTDGFKIYVTPAIMPGEFKIGAREKAAA